MNKEIAFGFDSDLYMGCGDTLFKLKDGIPIEVCRLECTITDLEAFTDGKLYIATA